MRASQTGLGALSGDEIILLNCHGPFFALSKPSASAEWLTISGKRRPFVVNVRPGLCTIWPKGLSPGFRRTVDTIDVVESCLPQRCVWGTSCGLSSAVFGVGLGKVGQACGGICR